MWHKRRVLEEFPPIPVVVDDDPMVTEGRIVEEGNNPWVEVRLTSGIYRASRFSWEAVLQALNFPRGNRLPIDRQEKPWSCPVIPL